MEKIRSLKYFIFDPTGNITALVETAVDVAMQPSVAARIMEREPDVEQVGFLTYDGKYGSGDGMVPISLRMAGGEFCGNAAMCAAALFAIRHELPDGTVPVKVSGTDETLQVNLERQADSSYSAAVSMPPAVAIEELIPETAEALAFGRTALPIVIMDGISHIIVEPDSEYMSLKDDSRLAESLLKQWCGELGAECLGMMFLGEGSGFRSLTPLVYVPGADTMFWENSCASGSAAAGMYLAAKVGSPVDVTFDEPAGRLRVESDPAAGTTVLHGSTKLVKHSLQN